MEEVYKPQTKQELAHAYGVTLRTISSWLEPHLDEVGERNRVNTIFDISRSLSMSYDKSKKGIKDFSANLPPSVPGAGLERARTQCPKDFNSYLLYMILKIKRPPPQ